MGNCCGTAAAVDDKDNVRRNKGQRLSNWSKTGVIALRRAALTVSRWHTGLAAHRHVLALLLRICLQLQAPQSS